MNSLHLSPRVRHVVLMLPLVVWSLAYAGQEVLASSPGPTRSSPIALTSDDRFVWAVNRENNSVSVLEVGNDLNQKVREIKVGVEPRAIAIKPDDKKVYVTNMVSGTVSVINTNALKVVKVIPVGTEPFGCALTPDGSKLYVANFSSDNISVINTTNDQVTTTIALPAGNNKPRAIAVSTDNKVYVTSFLAHLRDDGRTIDQKEGRDDGKEGHVTVISSTTDTVLSTVVLEPVADTGFLSNGSVLDRIPTTDPATFTFTTGAFPNLLQGIALKGGHAYLPCLGSSPNGPFRFNVNVQGLISVIDTTSDVDAGLTLNMNRGVQFENV
jgi:YVTN family beta-propeller protein